MVGRSLRLELGFRKDNTDFVKFVGVWFVFLVIFFWGWV